MVLKRLRSLFRSPYLYFATLVNGLLVALGAWLHSVSPYDHPYHFVWLVIFFLFLCLFDIFIKLIYERKQASVVYDQLIIDWLRVAAVAMLKAADPAHDSIRANIMLPDKHLQKLSIKYAYGFEDSDLDRYINIPMNTGCAGQAWLQCQPFVGDPTHLFATIVQWGLPPSEIKKIRPSLKSIFSIPIQVDSKCIGVLNFDSDNDKEEMKFDDPRVQVIGFSFASVFAVILLHTEGVR